MWRLRARGRAVRQPGTMNKLETAYSQYLGLRKSAGEVAWFAYEAIKLRLADRTFLTIDFFVMLVSGELEAHEVKGGLMEDDAAVKLKVAANMYPFKFMLVRMQAGSWNVKEI